MYFKFTHIIITFCCNVYNHVFTLLILPRTCNLQAYATLAYRVVSYVGCAISLLCLIATIIFLITLR